MKADVFWVVCIKEGSRKESYLECTLGNKKKKAQRYSLFLRVEENSQVQEY